MADTPPRLMRVIDIVHNASLPVAIDWDNCKVRFLEENDPEYVQAVASPFIFDGFVRRKVA